MGNTCKSIADSFQRMTKPTTIKKKKFKTKTINIEAFLSEMGKIFKFYLSIHFTLMFAAAAKSLQSCPPLQPHRWQPTRLRGPWDSPGKNTGVGCCETVTANTITGSLD